MEEKRDEREGEENRGLKLLPGMGHDAYAIHLNFAPPLLYLIRFLLVTLRSVSVD